MTTRASAKFHFNNVIGEAIRKSREAESLTRLELGRISGVGHDAIYKAEHGDGISLFALAHIAESLEGVTLDQLVPIEATRDSRSDRGAARRQRDIRSSNRGATSRDPTDAEEEYETLKDFARAVHEYIHANVPARSPYRFGRFKVFLAALPVMDSRSGKRLLVRAHQAGVLRLARADLTPAMDKRIVAASELRGGPGDRFEWHFVDTER